MSISRLCLISGLVFTTASLGACTSLPGAYAWKQASKAKCEYATGSHLCINAQDQQFAKDNDPSMNYQHTLPHD